MAERRNPPQPPTLDDYRTMMNKTRAPERLKEAVLQEARARRGKAHAAQTERPSVRAAASARRPVRAITSSKRHQAKAFAAAACLVLLAGVGTAALALGIPGLLQSPDNGGNSFFLSAYAVEGTSAEPGTTIILGADELWGSSSGRWFDPDTGSFRAYDEWNGYKFGFNLKCSGRNIDSITYEIEGEHAFFETINLEKASRPSTQEEIESGNTSAYGYSKSITLDYDKQQGIQEDSIYSIYLGFPVPEAARQAMYDQQAGNDAHFLFYEIAKSLDIAAADALAECKFHLTASFKDGSTQTKTYVIVSVEDLEERVVSYWNACRDDARPEKPELYTIVEVPAE